MLRTNRYKLNGNTRSNESKRVISWPLFQRTLRAVLPAL